jgi:hypothetical protein
VFLSTKLWFHTAIGVTDAQLNEWINGRRSTKRRRPAQDMLVKRTDEEDRALVRQAELAHSVIENRPGLAQADNRLA